MTPRAPTTPGPRTPKGRPAVVQLVDRADSHVPLYARLVKQLRDQILAGALRPGTRLPAARLMARDLAVSRNTVEAAYGQLQSEGFLTRRVGAGTTVTANLPAFPRASGERAAPASRHPDVPVSPLVRLGADELDGDRVGGPCMVDLRHFPLGIWTRILTRVARREAVAMLRPGDPMGEPALREAIAGHLALTRGVRCDPGQVLVVHSTQQALDLATRVLLPRGGKAIVEEPGYPAARRLFAAAGAAVTPVPVDSEGLEVARLGRGSDPAIVYVTPSHQYPLGMPLSLPRRLALLQWAQETGAWILEDDYDSEFQHDGRPIAALQGLDRHDRVIYLGTWNKVLFPGLRLAFLVLPAAEAPAFCAARRLMDGPPPPLLQHALAEFISEGHLAAYLRSARQHYTRRRDVLLEAAAAAWGPSVTFGPSDSGLHLVAHFPADTDDLAVAEHTPDALRVGVGALSRYYSHPGRARGLLLSYGAASPLGIRRAVEVLTPHLRRLIP